MNTQNIKSIRWNNEFMAFFTKDEDFALYYDLDAIEHLLTKTISAPVPFISAIPIFWTFAEQQIRYLFSIQGTRQYLFSPSFINGQAFHGDFKILDDADKKYCEMYFNQLTKHGVFNKDTTH